MNYVKKKAINELAARLIRILELDAPVQIEEIPKRLGGKLQYIDGLIDGEMEAMIIKDSPDSFTIVVSNYKPLVRKRFSIAHELGHLFLHMGYLINPDIWKKTVEYKDSVYYRFGYSKEELEANEFAGALLMPEREFKTIAVKNLHQGYYDISRIADHFQVSVDAARVRGRQLGLFSWE